MLILHVTFEQTMGASRASDCALRLRTKRATRPNAATIDDETQSSVAYVGPRKASEATNVYESTKPP